MIQKGNLVNFICFRVNTKPWKKKIVILAEMLYMYYERMLQNFYLRLLGCFLSWKIILMAAQLLSSIQYCRWKLAHKDLDYICLYKPEAQQDIIVHNYSGWEDSRARSDYSNTKERRLGGIIWVGFSKSILMLQFHTKISYQYSWLTWLVKFPFVKILERKIQKSDFPCVVLKYKKCLFKISKW